MLICVFELMEFYCHHSNISGACVVSPASLLRHICSVIYFECA